MADLSPRKSQAEPPDEESAEQHLARTITTPECLSASVLTICHRVDHAQVTEVVGELKRQSAAINADDLSRAEGMLSAQAHTLDGLFAKLTSDALSTSDMDMFERYMKLALKAQNQARATLQTLVELKAPKKFAFFQQANIGDQVQVNNERKSVRTRKNQKERNELLEANYGERLDTRAAGAAGRADTAMATMERKHRAKKR